MMFKHDEGVFLVGAGPVNLKLFQPFVDAIPNFYCADGGVNYCEKIPYKINAVIGDLDSAKLDKYDGKVSQWVRISGQNDTDFEKCLSRIEARFYLGVGFIGDRLDHTLANLSALTKFPEKPVFLVDDVNLCFRLPKRLRLSLPKGTRFSLFPLTQASVRSEGLKWSVTGMDLHPTGLISTSNETDAQEVTLERTSGEVIVMTEAGVTQAVLDQAVDQLANG